VIIKKEDYQKEEGLLSKSYSRTVAYLKKFCGSKQAKEYEDHCVNFSKKFNGIK